MNDGTVRTAVLSLALLGAIAIICIAIVILVLDNPDVAVLAVLASIASAAVGGVAGAVSVQGAAPPLGGQNLSPSNGQVQQPNIQQPQPGARQ